MNALETSDDSSLARRGGLVAWARMYRGLGLVLTPVWGVLGGVCRCSRGKECPSPGKHPKGGKAWNEQPSAEPEHWVENQQDSIGVITGKTSGIVVLDVDGEAGVETLGALEAKHGPLPATATVYTGKGQHLYFSHPEGEEIHGRVGKHGLGPGLDLRAKGNMVVAPPSHHASGRKYYVLKNESQGFTEAGFAVPPPWLVQLMREPPGLDGRSVRPQRSRPPPTEEGHHGDARARRYGRAALDGAVRFMSEQHEGTRDDTLNEQVFKLSGLNAGIGAPTFHDVEAELRAAAIGGGLGEREVDAKFHGETSAWERGQRHPFAPDWHISMAQQLSGSKGHASEDLASGNDAGQTHPRFVTWNLWRRTARTEMRYLLDPYLPQGALVFVAADGKSGKTMFCSYLVAEYLMRNQDGRALVTEKDGTEPDLYQAVSTFLDRHSGNHHDGELEDGATAEGERLLVSYRQPHMLEEKSEELQNLIDDVLESRSKLVVVDALLFFHQGDESSSRDMGMVLRGLQRLITETGATVIVIHHFRKPGNTRGGKRSEPEEVDQRGFDMTGSARLRDGADMVIGLVKVGEDKDLLRFRVWQAAGRRQPWEPRLCTVRFSGPARGLTSIVEEAAVTPPGGEQGEALAEMLEELLTEVPQGVKALRGTVKRGFSAVATALKWLVQHGRARHVREGPRDRWGYTIPGSTMPTAATAPMSLDVIGAVGDIGEAKPEPEAMEPTAPMSPPP